MGWITAINWADARGSFMKFDGAFVPAEVCFSVNPQVGTLRGLHYEVDAGARCKAVYCVRGRLWDIGVKVSTGAQSSRYLGPGEGALWGEGIAHGFITLAPDTELLYLMGKAYMPECARGLRWNDPKLNIEWPMQPTIVSDRDASFPDWEAR